MNKQFGHYEIVSELGRGGMGVVYKAHEQSLSRFVAIKVLAEALATDEVVVERFIREARAVAALNHPNVIQVYFAGNEKGQPFFAMEYVKGEPLSKVIRRESPLSPYKAAGLILQAARGLASAHSKGIVHRDIKPANLMLTPEGVVKVADFGIAHAEDLGNKLTNTGEFVGTPGYLSPEVCTGEEVDQRSDIFALGVVFYEMLAGHTPFQDESPLGMMLEVVKSEVPDIRQLNADVDDVTVAILAKMLEKKPQDRYQDCQQIVLDLEKGFSEQAFSQQESDATSPPVQMAPPETLPSSNAPGITPPTMPRMVDPDNVPAISPQDTIITTVNKKNDKPSLMAIAAMIFAVAMIGGGGYFAVNKYVLNTGENDSGDIARLMLASDVTAENKTPQKDVDNTQANPVNENIMPEVVPDVLAADHSGVAKAQAETQNLIVEPQEKSQGQKNDQFSAVKTGVQTVSTQADLAFSQPVNISADGQATITAPRSGNSNQNNFASNSMVAKVTPVDAVNEWKQASIQRLDKGHPKVLIVNAGERAASQVAKSQLEAYLDDAGIVLGDSVVLGYGAQGWSGEGVDIKRLKRSALKNGIDIIIWVNVRYMGEQTLDYYGRNSQLVTSQIEVKAFRVHDNERLGRTWRAEARYTSLNLQDQVKAAIADIADRIINKIQYADKPSA